MHIPDNYLSPTTCAVLGAAMLPVWKVATAKVKKEITRKKMPLLGIGAAFSFLIMMFNLPLPGGTTGHAVGAALIAILLGPYSAVIAVTIALVVQALFFGDGGILAIGANTFNMAFIMPFAAHYIFNFLKSIFKGKRGEYYTAFLAGYISLNLAALFTAIEFGIQPLLFKGTNGMPLYCPYPLSVSIPAMLIPHLAVAGFVEGFATVGIYAYIKKLSPDIIYDREKEMKIKPLYAAIVAMILLSPIGLLAAGTAWGEWGLDEIKELTGFIPKGMEKGFSFNSMMPDYTVNGLSEVIGYIASAVVGILIILLLFKLLEKGVAKASKK